MSQPSTNDPSINSVNQLKLGMLFNELCTLYAMEIVAFVVYGARL